jgi:hypothetical protein
MVLINGGEHDGGVLVHADLDQALQVPQLQRQRVGHHDVRRIAERRRGEGLPFGVDDLCALLALGLGLSRHGPFHAVGQLDVLQLHQGYFHAPLDGADVEDFADVEIDAVGFGDVDADVVAGYDALLILLVLSVKIIKQYEQGVLFRLGRVLGVRAPGLRVIIRSSTCFTASRFGSSRCRSSPGQGLIHHTTPAVRCPGSPRAGCP